MEDTQSYRSLGFSLNGHPCVSGDYADDHMLAGAKGWICPADSREMNGDRAPCDIAYNRFAVVNELISGDCDQLFINHTELAYWIAKLGVPVSSRQQESLANKE